MSRRLLSGNKGVMFSVIAIIILAIIAIEFEIAKKPFISNEGINEARSRTVVSSINTFDTVFLPHLMEERIRSAFDEVSQCLFTTYTINPTNNQKSNDCGSFGDNGFFESEKDVTDAVKAVLTSDSSLPLGLEHVQIISDTQVPPISKKISESMNINNINIKLTDLTIQLSPLTADFKHITANVTLKYSASAFDAVWTDRVVGLKNLRIPIDNLYDPYMTIMKNSKNHPFRISFYNLDGLDATSSNPSARHLSVDDFKNIVTNQKYVFNPSAPDFFKRFTNNMTAISASLNNGFETFVRVSSTEQLRIRPMVDWKYWNIFNQNIHLIFTRQAGYDDFIMDKSHADYYLGSVSQFLDKCECISGSYSPYNCIKTAHNQQIEGSCS